MENTYTLDSDNLQFSIFNYDLEDDFKKDSILEINARLLYDYNSYNNIGKLIHNLNYMIVKIFYFMNLNHLNQMLEIT